MFLEGGAGGLSETYHWQQHCRFYTMRDTVHLFRHSTKDLETLT